jgi:hypothetical protein
MSNDMDFIALNHLRFRASPELNVVQGDLPFEICG